MAKDRDQMTPDDPDDWSELQTSRGQGTGGTGYDRLPGEESRPPLQDRNSTAETIPEPLDDEQPAGDGSTGSAGGDADSDDIE